MQSKIKPSQEAAFRGAPAAMIVVDTQNDIAEINDAFYALTGWSEISIVGHPVTVLLANQTGTTARWLADNDTSTDQRGPEHPKSLALLRPDGSVLPSQIVRRKLIDPESGNLGWVGVISAASGAERCEAHQNMPQTADLSEGHHRTVHELKNRCERLEAFTQTVTHDLKAPLRHLVAFSRLLREELADTDRAHETINAIASSAQRLSTLVTNLRDFATIPKVKPALHKTAVEDLIGVAIEHLSEQIIQTNARIDVSPMPHILCDQAMMETVFTHVLSNALNYVAPGIRPLVSISQRPLRNDMDIVFTDNGIGIPKQFRERVFQPLTRLHGSDCSYPGSGLGLALCREIVERHAGQILLDDNVSGGCRVTIRLPLQPPRESFSSRDIDRAVKA